MTADRSQLRSQVLGPLFYGTAVGFALWALSPVLWGVSEPWDTDRYWYSGIMFSTGLLLGILSPRSPVPGYLGSWFGQVAALLVLPSFQTGWLLLGVITTGIGSLIFVLGAACGVRLRSLTRSRRAA